MSTITPQRESQARRAFPISPISAVMLTIAAVMGLFAFLWPLLVTPSADLLAAPNGSVVTAPIIMAALLPMLLAVVIVQLSNSDIDVKALAMLGVLTAVGAVARSLGAGTAGIETVFFLIILGGRVFGPGMGFVLGNTTLLLSALLTGGIGTWLPHQMIGAGFFGLFAGLLPKARGKVEIAMLAVYGAIGSFLYGMAMDFAFWPFAVVGGDAGFDPTVGALENLHRFLVVNLVTGMGWNAGRAISNVLLVTLLGPPLLRVLRRAARKATFSGEHAS